MNILIRIVITLIYSALWCIIGPIIWIPLLFQEVLLLFINLFASSFGYAEISVGIEHLRKAIVFLFDHYYLILNSIWKGRDNAKDFIKFDIAKTLYAFFILVFIWLIIIGTVFVTYKYGNNILICVNNYLFADNSKSIDTKTQNIYDYQHLFDSTCVAAYSYMRRPKWYQGFQEFNTMIEISLVRISQNNKLTPYLYIQIKNTGIQMCESLQHFIWVGLSTSSIRWDYPKITTLRSGETIIQEAKGTWIGKPILLSKERGEYEFHIGNGSINIDEKTTIVTVLNENTNILNKTNEDRRN